MTISDGVGRAVLNRDAMVYPAVRDLVHSGYLDCQQEVVEERTEHVCRLTDRGKEAYVATANAWERIRYSKRGGRRRTALTG